MRQSAPVHALADESRSHAEAASWLRFTTAADASALLEAWLQLLCLRVPRVRAGLLLARDADDAPFTVAAVWPDARRDLQYLTPVAQRALGSREGVVGAADGGHGPSPDGACHIGYPVEVGGQLHAAVVLDLGPGPLDGLQEAMRHVHWGSAWLIDHFRQRALQLSRARLDRVQSLNALMATAMQFPGVQASALAVANELTLALAADRVSVGLVHDDAVRPLVLSHTGHFDARSDLARWLGEAMDEVVDLGSTMAHPAPADEPCAALAHAESARQLGVQAMLSVPLPDATGQAIGVLTAERTHGPAFSDDERQRLQAAGVMLGPLWSVLAERERGWLQRTRLGLVAGVRQLFGPSHPGLKLLGAAALVLGAVLALWQTEHRVTARTVVEGAVQLAAVAPFDGYVAQGLVRAGDAVRAGQPMARLDDRDLQLERSRLAAEIEQLQRRHQVAQAGADRAAMGVLDAQLRQTEAQLALVRERLERATVRAPFDGLVVSGDLSQQIGSPVETGKLLFEVAPASGYRVMMQVDDRDIAAVQPGQGGELLLSGRPDRPLALRVERVTPVASQREGRNVFAVEASLTGAAEGRPALRPGMEGVAKVAVGERSLLWIWTHGTVNAVRLALWRWLP